MKVLNTAITLIDNKNVPWVVSENLWRFVDPNKLLEEIVPTWTSRDAAEVAFWSKTLLLQERHWRICNVTMKGICFLRKFNSLCKLCEMNSPDIEQHFMKVSKAGTNLSRELYDDHRTWLLQLKRSYTGACNTKGGKLDVEEGQFNCVTIPGNKKKGFNEKAIQENRNEARWQLQNQEESSLRNFFKELENRKAWTNIK